MIETNFLILEPLSLIHQPHPSFALPIPFPSTTQAQTAWLGLGSTWVVLGNPLPIVRK